MMPMKTTSLSLVLVLFVSACAHAADSNATDTSHTEIDPWDAALSARAADSFSIRSSARMATQVVAEKQTVRLGDPIVVSLSVSNQTQRAQGMDRNPTVFGNIEITDPDGKTLPYVGFTGQVRLDRVAVQPGSTVTNVGTLNLPDAYLFQKAGRYSVRFSGDTFDLSNSPAIEIEVTAGRLPDIDEMAALLLPVRPKSWGLEKNRGRMSSGPFSQGFGLLLYDNYMQGETVNLWFRKEEVKVDPNQQPPFKMEYLGHGRGQFVYGLVGTNALAIWPTAIEDISRALQITKQ